MIETQDEVKKYYGKYRGTVSNNVDPLQIGRIMALVPDVSTIYPTGWAMPCLPMFGINTGVFTLPQLGAGVWIEFEQGDPDYPIWVGGYWGIAAERPALSHTVPPGVSGVTMQTTALTGIVVSDTPGVGGVTIYCRGVPALAITDAGITMMNGKGAMMTMVGPAVDFNGGALTVAS